jgi:hypothetical protein
MAGLDAQSTAAARFYREVRDFAVKTPVWGEALRYHTKPDERCDITLASRRVYGRRDEFMVIAAAAGLDSVEQPMPEQLLVLPTEQQLRALKTRAGFRNLDSQRDS